MKHYTLVLFFLLMCIGMNAQVFPVQVIPQLAPPYSPFLSDYTAAGAQNLMLQIHTNDVTLFNYPCKLRITIEGVGITITTKPNFIARPLTLEGGGVPQMFYGEDLADYFHPNALDFSGITRSEFEKSARLPEGVYRFTIEVLDYYRGTVVSNKGTTTAWIIYNDPPLLNLPANLSNLAVQEPINILFTWTPRHTGSPNAAFSTEYIFRLIEIWPENRNPYDAFLTQYPLFEITTTQNQILYSLSEPALIPGRKYAWQVEARDTGGKDLFKNNGRSEVFVFKYGEPLAVPQNLNMRWAKPTTLAIRWDPVRAGTEEIKYRLQYRPRRRSEPHDWYETKTQFTEKTLYHLQSNTEYEMRVRAEKVSQESEYTDTRIFKTLLPEVNVFVCKDNVEPPPLPETTLPVFPLSINDTLHAGGYDVLVRDVIEIDGRYYGSGFAIVPWFNGAKVSVTFEKISVNDRFWLRTGTIKSVWNPESEFLLETETPVTPGSAPQAGELDITIVAADSLIIVEGVAIAAVTKDEEGNIIVETTDGKQQTLPKGQSYAIADEVGNGYVIDKEGNIAKTTAAEAKASAARGDRIYNLAFEFSKGDGRFGFDEKKFNALAPWYQQLEDGTYVPWKALSASHTDVIEGKLLSGDVDITRIRFEAGSTPVMPITSGEAQVKLTLQGRMAGMEEELLALYSSADTLPDKVVGKLNLATYNPIHYNLEIIPVNGVALPGGLNAETISKTLNTVFGQAVVEWSVRVSNPLAVALDETFDEGETGLFSNYTADMKKVLRAHGPLQDNTYYLFLISEPRNESTLGYMPRSKQAGFVFVGPHNGDAEEFLKTIAHELGHGAFNLKHTFTEHTLPSGTTDNLMDYSRGTALFKYQWDYIHEPQRVMGLFEGEDEGASVIVTNMTQLKEFANPDGSFTFLAPTGIPFTLPPSTQSVIFWTNDTYSDGVIQPDDSPDGALIAFTIGSTTYKYHKIEGGNSGAGYKIQKGDIAYQDILSKDQTDIQHAIIGLPCVENEDLTFIAQKVLFQSDVPEENYSAEGEIVSKLPIENPYGPYFSSPKIKLDAKLNFTYTDEAKAFIGDNRACLNEMVRYVIKAADVIQRNPGYYELYKSCKAEALKYPDTGNSSTEDAFRLGIYYEKLKGFAEELNNYINETRYSQETLLDIKDPQTLSALLKNTCQPDFKLFTFEQREHIIKILSAGNMQDYWLGLGNSRENIVIYTLQQAPEGQFAEILEILKRDSYALLKTLVNKCNNQLIGQDNFDKLIDAVAVMIQKTYVYENFENDVLADRVLRWGASDLFRSYEYECHGWEVDPGTETITFSSSSSSHHYPGGGEYTGTRIVSTETKYPPFSADPFDFVTLKLYDDISLEDGNPILTRSVGEFQAVPAIYLYWIIQRKATDRTLAHLKANVNLMLFFIGGAEIMAARTGFRLAFAIADQTLFATSFVLDAGPRKMLEEGPNGEEWKSVFKTFDAFNLVYGAARLGQGVFLSAKEVIAKRALLKQLQEVEDFNNFTPAQQTILKTEIAKVDRGMDEMEMILKVNNVVEESADLLTVFNKLSQDLQNRLQLLPKKQMDDLLHDLGSSTELSSKMTVEMVDGWEVLANNPVLRKRTSNLQILGNWISKGAEKEKLTIGVAKAPAKQKLIEDLQKANSKIHVQVMIKDYDNIPGVVKGRYVPNGSKLSDKAEIPEGWASDFDLPEHEIMNFTDKIEPIEFVAGETIYRVSPFDKRGYSYWTRKKPEKLSDVIGGTAVEPEWNNFEYIHEYKVPEGVTIKGWIGKTARKDVSDVAPGNYHLPGSDEQVYISTINRQDINFESVVKSQLTKW